jgi:hypothetical protein
MNAIFHAAKITEGIIIIEDPAKVVQKDSKNRCFMIFGRISPAKMTLEIFEKS